MIYYELSAKDGEIIRSTIKNESKFLVFNSHKDKNCEIGEFKQVYRESDFGNIRLIGDKKDDSLSTSRISTRTAKVYSNLIPFLQEVQMTQKTEYAIFSHNLITTHSRLQDEIESIIPEEKLAHALNYKDQISIIKDKLEKETLSTSESIFEIAKRIIDLEAQITGFKILSGSIKPDIWRQNLKKVLLNILYPYYNDFKKNEIEIRVWIDEQLAADNLVMLDYKVFNIAMYHFLNNAVKYAKPNSYIDINFDPARKELSFDMVSVKIEKHEIESIFEMKISGYHSKKLSGDGIGMFMLKKALELLSTKMYVTPDYSMVREYDDLIYTRNTFSIIFL